MFTKEEIETIKYSLINNIFDLSDELGLLCNEEAVKSKEVKELIKHLDFLYEVYNK